MIPLVLTLLIISSDQSLAALAAPRESSASSSAPVIVPHPPEASLDNNGGGKNNSEGTGNVLLKSEARFESREQVVAKGVNTLVYRPSVYSEQRVLYNNPGEGISGYSGNAAYYYLQPVYAGYYAYQPTYYYPSSYGYGGGGGGLFGGGAFGFCLFCLGGG